MSRADKMVIAPVVVIALCACWAITGHLSYAIVAGIWVIAVIVLSQRSVREMILLVAVMVALVIVTINFFISVAGSLALFGLAKVAGMRLE